MNFQRARFRILFINDRPCFLPLNIQARIEVEIDGYCFQIHGTSLYTII